MWYYYYPHATHGVLTCHGNPSSPNLPAFNDGLALRATLTLPHCLAAFETGTGCYSYSFVTAYIPAGVDEHYLRRIVPQFPDDGGFDQHDGRANPVYPGMLNQAVPVLPTALRAIIPVPYLPAIIEPVCITPPSLCALPLLV